MSTGKMRKIRVGSRDSALAVKQTLLVVEAIARAHPELDIELVTMKTSGDLNQSHFDEINKVDKTSKADKVNRNTFGAKGLFVKELELALLDGRIDLAVHSLKDMPARSVRPEMETPLPLLAFFKRGDPRDVLVLPIEDADDADQKEGGIGCSSARRRVQLERLFPGCSVRPIRGNVLTRLRKLDGGGDEGQKYSSLVLAAAGLIRLDLEHRIHRIFSPDEIIPAAGQGTLAIQAPHDCDYFDYGFLNSVNDTDSEDCAKCEMAFVERLGGGCTLPMAAYAEVHGTEISLIGLYADEASGIYRKERLAGDRKDAVKLGETLAERLMLEGEEFGR